MTPQDRALAERAIRATLAYLKIDNPRAEGEWLPAILARVEGVMGGEAAETHSSTVKGRGLITGACPVLETRAADVPAKEDGAAALDI